MESSPKALGSAEPAIKRAFSELDRLLRGEVTQTASLQRGAIDVDPARLSLVAIVLSMVYGACMGTFALFSARTASAMQVLASMIKVPALFFLTLLVTLPSLYVFNALVGSRLTVGAVVRLLVATLGVIVAVLASLGPIVAFFGSSVFKCKTSRIGLSGPWPSGGCARSSSRSLATPDSGPRSIGPTDSSLTSVHRYAW